jgi:cyclase
MNNVNQIKTNLIFEDYLKDFENMFDLLKTTNISALAAASIYHFTKKTPLDVKKYLKEKKIPVRL